MKENEEIKVEEVEVEETEQQEQVEVLRLCDSRQTLQQMLEETEDPKMVEAIGKAIASISESMINEESNRDKYGMMERDFELREKELEQQKAIQEKQIETQKQQIKVTKLAAILGIGGTLVTAGLKLVGIITQGQQAIEYQREGYAEEKSDEPCVYKSNKHLIPNVFSKNQ